MSFQRKKGTRTKRKKKDQVDTVSQMWGSLLQTPWGPSKRASFEGCWPFYSVCYSWKLIAQITETMRQKQARRARAKDPVPWRNTTLVSNTVIHEKGKQESRSTSVSQECYAASEWTNTINVSTAQWGRTSKLKPLVVTNSLSKICCKVPQEKTWKVEHTTERSRPVPNRGNSSLRQGTLGRNCEPREFVGQLGVFTWRKKKGLLNWIVSDVWFQNCDRAGKTQEVERLSPSNHIFSRFKSEVWQF